MDDRSRRPWKVFDRLLQIVTGHSPPELTEDRPDLELARLVAAIRTGNLKPLLRYIPRKDWLISPRRFASLAESFRCPVLIMPILNRAYGPNATQVVVLAEALVEASRQTYREMNAFQETGGPVGRDLAFMKATAATNYLQAIDLLATAYRQTMRFVDVVDVAQPIVPLAAELYDAAEPSLAPHPEVFWMFVESFRSPLVGLGSKGAAALQALGRIDEAFAFLDPFEMLETKLRGALPAIPKGELRNPGFGAIRRALEGDRGHATDVATPKTLDEVARDKYRQSTADSVLTLRETGLEEEAAHMEARFSGILQGSVPMTAADVLRRPYFPIDHPIVRRMHDPAEWRHRATTNRITVRLIEGESSVEELRAMRAELIPIRDWYLRSGKQDDTCTLLWVLSRIEQRLGDHAQALESMAPIRTWVEARRLGIENPLGRAAISEIYPHLYEAIVKSSFALGQLNSALSAMEAAKGRAVAELRLAREGATLDQERREAVLATRAADGIESLTAQLGIDYLSYFVGLDETFAILVTASGTWHSHRIAIPKPEIVRLMRQVEPGSWDNPYARRADRHLAPLVDWIPGLLESALLVISPDDPLHNLPFHYLHVAGQLLTDLVATVRVHGADDLRAVRNTQSRRPSQGHLVYIPARDEGGNVAGRRAAFERLHQAISIPTDTLDATAFDRNAASTLKVPDQLFHIGAHGFWPPVMEDGKQADPYFKSGLLLATAGELPLRPAASDGSVREPAVAELMSPQMVIESADLNVTGAVICIQACVSGLSIEGRAGDALGLEWALLARGAQTVLASHWNIKFPVAQRFFEDFYFHWLEENMSRAQAYQKTMKDLRSDPALQKHGLEWAAFSLIGDWR